MSNYLAPAYFSAVARATLKVALQDDMDEENLAAPSNALKLSYDIKRLCDVKVGCGIKTGNKVMREEAEDFITLMRIEWSTKLERELLEERKAEKKRHMPLPSDVEKLAPYHKQEAKNMNLDEASYENYRRAGLQNPRDRGTAGPRKKLTPAENFQNWKEKKKKRKEKEKPSQKKMKMLT